MKLQGGTAAFEQNDETLLFCNGKVHGTAACFGQNGETVLSFQSEKSAIQYINENKLELLNEMNNYETRIIYSEGETKVFVRKINRDIAICVNRYGAVKK